MQSARIVDAQKIEQLQQEIQAKEAALQQMQSELKQKDLHFAEERRRLEAKVRLH